MMVENKQKILLSLENINKSFPGVQALKDVTINVKEAEVLGLCGENGAGKSTLLKVFSGIYQADSGKIIFDGSERFFKHPQDSIEAGISVIHQELNYCGELSIAENIFLGRLPKTNGIVDWKRMNEEAKRLLTEFDITLNPAILMKDIPSTMQQLVEIVKAISIHAKIIVMDEPTAYLGMEEVEKFMSIIREIKNKGISFIFVSHRLKEIIEICDRLVVLRDGQNVAELNRDEFDEFTIISKMIGRKVTQLYPKEEIEMGETVLELDNVSSNALKNISLEVRAGEIAGLYGMAGEGQDEILRTIFGLTGNYTGKIIFNGEEISLKTPKDAIDNGVVYVTEDRKKDGLILDHTVQQNTVLASLRQILNKLGLIDYKKEHEIGKRWVEELNVRTASLKAEMSKLSGGNQQKVIIGKWLQTTPKLMLLNEPMRGVDIGAKQEIFTIIQNLCKQGMSVLMITSDMLELLNMCDKIYTVYQGKITAHFTNEDATQYKIMLASINKIDGLQENAE
jgi:ribose transport system ATP-binding protein